MLEICSTEAFSEVEARVARVTLFSSLLSICSLITSLGFVDSLDLISLDDSILLTLFVIALVSTRNYTNVIFRGQFLCL